ncbi:MAG: hypothetical protein RL531_1831 [Actinomycetota bacterium]|jgi:plastocyanin
MTGHRGLRRIAALVTAGAVGFGGITAVAGAAGAATGTRPRAPEVGAAARPGAAYNELTVTMVDNVNAPRTATINPGTTIHWANEGRNEHNVKPNRAGAGFGDDLIGVGEEYQHTFQTPGVFGYYCSFHGTPGKGMYGTVIVRNADGSLPDGADKVDKGRSGPAARGKPITIRVPKDVRTIQGAVDRAKPGDMVLVSPGVYHEAVVITTDRIVLRGLDRNRVILDGRYQLENGVKVIDADGVAVENMTARKYERNGFFWTGAKGYRGSYLTSTRTGDYGIYAFDSVDGWFDHDYGAGSPDAGFYIGQCYPCNAMITHSISEYNGLGYSGTNAGGDLVITNSLWRFNRAGIVPNSGDGEANPPERETTVIGNVVYDNNNGQTPAIDAAKLAQGNGILVAGGEDNLITKNLVFDHDVAGIVTVLNPEKNVWFPNNNTTIDNTVRDSREADLATFGGEGNCFAGNRFATSKPSNIEQTNPCPSGTKGIEPTDQLDLQKYIDATKPPTVDYRIAKTPKPPKLANMPNAASAKAAPAVGIAARVKAWIKREQGKVRTPKAPKDLRTTQVPVP